MNGLVIVLIAIVVLGAGYLLYGRWLASKWGLDPKAKTPAYTHEDGQDYVPSSKLTVFVRDLSPDRSWHPYSAGCRYCYGC